MSLLFCITNKTVFYVDPFRVHKIKHAFSAGSRRTGTRHFAPCSHQPWKPQQTWPHSCQSAPDTCYNFSLPHSPHSCPTWSPAFCTQQHHGLTLPTWLKSDKPFCLLAFYFLRNLEHRILIGMLLEYLTQFSFQILTSTFNIITEFAWNTIYTAPCKLWFSLVTHSYMLRMI